MSDRIDVFISSTNSDLQPYREAVIKQILRSEFHPIGMEMFNPTSMNALQLCYNKVQQADLFIGIYAHRYGYAPSSEVTFTTVDGDIISGDGETGITHWEYLWALERNLPILLFVVNDTDVEGNYLNWPVPFIEAEPGKIRLDNFKSMIMENHTVGFFYSPDHLASQVATALLNFSLTQPVQSVKSDLFDQLRVVGTPVLDIATHFRNRDGERKEIGCLLADPATRVVSVIGMGGIGKTALVSKVLAEIEAGVWLHEQEKLDLNGIIYLSTRTDGISLERIFLDCAELFDAHKRDVIVAIWTNLQLTTQEKITKLLEALKDGVYIILLDNMEDLLDVNREIENDDLRMFFEMLLRSPISSRLLITTREPLAFPREVMRFDQRIHLQDGLPDDEAVEILKDLDPHGNYGLRDAKEEQLLQVVHRVHGVPRALEVVASIMANDSMLAVSDLLSGDMLVSHPEFVEELVQENYRRFSQDYLHVVEALAVFGRPVPLKALESVLEPITPDLDVQAVLNRLIQIHTVSFDRKSKLASLHPIDRDFIYNQIPKNNLFTLEKRAGEFYLASRGNKTTWKSIVDLEPSLLGFDHLFKAEEYNAASEVLNEIHYEYLDAWGYHKRAFKMRHSLLGKISDRNLEGLNFGWLSFTPRPLMNNTQQREFVEQAIEVAKEVGNTSMLKIWELRLAETYDHDNEHQLALNKFNYLIDDAELQEMPHWHSRFLDGVRARFLRLGDVEQALLYGHKSLEIARNNKDKRREGLSLNDLGFTYSSIGDKVRGLQYYKDALSIAKDLNLIGSLGVRLSNIATIYVDIGEFNQAIDYFGQALEIAIQTDTQLGEVSRMGGLARCLYFLGDYEKSLDYRLRVIQLSRESNSKRREANYTITTAVNLAMLGDFTKASKFFEASQELVGNISLNNMSNYFRSLIYYFFIINDFYQVVRSFEDARNHFIHSHNKMDWDIEAIALLSLGSEEQALSVFKKVCLFSDERLNKTPQLFEERYRKAIALTGLALLETDGSKRAVAEKDARVALQEAVAMCNPIGVLKHFDIRFEKLEPVDDTGFVASLRMLLKPNS